MFDSEKILKHQFERDNFLLIELTCKQTDRGRCLLTNCYRSCQDRKIQRYIFR